MSALKIAEKCADNAFISRGFSNWKDAFVSFKKHEETNFHKDLL
jgi:hypothetical protein